MIAAAGLLVFVVRLVSWGRRGELASIGLGFAALVCVRIVLGAWYDGVADGEPRQYDRLAEAVLAGECCMSHWPMGYPLVLAGSYLLVEDRQLAVEGLNLLFAVVAGGAVLGLGRAAYGSRVGSAALFAYAIWPAGALMVDVRLPHTAYDLVIVAAASITLGTPPGQRGSLLTGMVLGASQFLRPTTAALLPAFLIARSWSGGPSRRVLSRDLAPLVVAFLLVLAPVAWQNLTAYGELSISTSSFGGQSLYIGTDQRSGGRFSREANAELIAIGGLDPRARSAIGTRIALERIRDDPVGIALLAIRKQDVLWATERFGVEYGIDRALRDRPANPRATTALLMSQGFLVTVLLATMLGLLKRRHQLEPLGALVICLVWSVSLAHALLEVRDRYHSYVIPVLLPLAAVGAVGVMDYLEARITRLRRPL